MIASPDDVLRFWFPEGLDESDAKNRAQVDWWFRGGEAADRVVREKFGDTHAAAVRGELDDWAKTPRGRLALILVLDQFSRNLERGKPEAYANDPKTTALVLDALDKDMVKDFTAWELMFMLVPLGHSEVLPAHDVAMKWKDEVVARAPAHLKRLYEGASKQTDAHRDEIVRFGRHPARNAILGRESTPAEREYLEKEGPAHERPTRNARTAGG
jgi:uncharacterized protein (DUF924 family)